MENFVRHESKYLLTRDEYKKLMEQINEYIKTDIHVSSHVLSVYFDTDDYRLLTRSIEKPKFKEKLRIRSYEPPLNNDDVYIELKKKLNGVVYKSRTRVNYNDVLNDLSSCDYEDEMIGNEIKNLVMRYEKLTPKILISCDREYFVGKEDPSLRITFDSNMKYRVKNVSLNDMEDDLSMNESIVMEIKVKDAIPLWLSKKLDELKIYRCSFSKVGTAYLKEIKR